LLRFLGDDFCFELPLQLPQLIDTIAKIFVRLEPLQRAAHLAGRRSPLRNGLARPLPKLSKLHVSTHSFCDGAYLLLLSKPKNHVAIIKARLKTRWLIPHKFVKTQCAVRPKFFWKFRRLLLVIFASSPRSQPKPPFPAVSGSSSLPFSQICFPLKGSVLTKQR